MTYSKKNVHAALIEVTNPLKCQEDFSTKWSKYAYTGFPKCVILQHKGMRSEAEGSVSLRSLEPSCGEALLKMVGSEMKDVGEWRLRQGRTKKSAKGLYCKGALRIDKVVEFLVVKKLEPTAKKILRKKKCTKQ